MLFLLTEYCSMGCPHCMHDSTVQGKHATFKLVRTFVRFAQRLETTKIGISGGEPTEHPNFLFHFRYIIDSLGDKADIQLITNGHFLFDEELSTKLSEIQKIRAFNIQITSIRGLYKKHSETVEMFSRKRHMFRHIDLVKELYFLEENVGRAIKNPLSQFRTGNTRRVPNCFNIYAAAKQLPTFKAIINYLDENTQFNFCKPMVDASGNVHPSEYVGCLSIGNIFRDTQETMYKNLVKSQPCELCGISIPKAYKDKLGWK